ncbi:MULTISPECIES: hypothetical protein [Niastella]|uniref:Neuromedin U n=1 Tax=Niastella soli TaxID=2821487 RepID=A0ABS3YY81_9BACT|nr:hypothetical protein [Niastella soli]MBO9202875.1 hypothetical protein [Niastella soli]
MKLPGIVLLVLIAITHNQLWAQQNPPPPGKGVSDEELKRANDPMANVKAFNVQDYIVSKLYGLPDQQLNQLLVRYTQPVGQFLLRGTMPFVTSSGDGKDPTSGLGDFNFFALYSFPSSNGNKFGIGPNLTVPTGTHELGAGKWQTGLSVLAFFANSHIVQVGSLLQWSVSFAGDDDRADVSLLTPQLFFIWQIGAGFCIRSTGVMSFNLKNGDYNVPIGLGVGKVLKAGNVVFNLFAEPQFTVLAEGIGQPRYQTFVGFNTQF